MSTLKRFEKLHHIRALLQKMERASFADADADRHAAVAAQTRAGEMASAIAEDARNLVRGGTTAAELESLHLLRMAQNRAVDHAKSATKAATERVETARIKLLRADKHVEVAQKLIRDCRSERDYVEAKAIDDMVISGYARRTYQ